MAFHVGKTTGLKVQRFNPFTGAMSPEFVLGSGGFSRVRVGRRMDFGCWQSMAKCLEVESRLSELECSTVHMVHFMVFPCIAE